jgi:hypothetical protein
MCSVDRSTIGEWWIGKDLEGRDRGINEVLCRKLPGRAEEIPEELQWDSWQLGANSNQANQK